LSIETIALNCLVFEKISFLCTHFGDRQTDAQMDGPDALRHIRYRERRFTRLVCCTGCRPHSRRFNQL